MPPEGFRQRLSEAADSLADFRRRSGVAPAAPPRVQPRSPSEEELRAAFGEAAERVRILEGELIAARRSIQDVATENRKLNEELLNLRAAFEEAEARSVPLREKATLLSAECLRLESMRRKAENEASSAESSGRALAESLRRELRETKAALERTQAEAGAQEARAKAEIEVLSKRLVSAVSRLQALEREKRLDAGRASGDAAAAQAELERAHAVVASLKAELTAVRDASARRESGLRQEAASAHYRAEDIKAAFESRGQELEHGQAAVARLRSELSAAREAAALVEAELRRDISVAKAALAAAESDAAAAAAALAARNEAPAPAPDAWPACDAPGDEIQDPPPFLQPGLDPVLDPGWSRLLRLVRPSVEAAYAHLRRLSTTALTTGQKALLRMAAASIAQATDSLASVELSLEEGPASAPPSSVVPLLDAVASSWESAYRRRGVALVREWSGPLPAAVHEEKALRVLLHHAYRNALEALPSGGRLAVRAARGEDGGLRIEFMDDGPGFPSTWLDRRFEPFASPRPGRAGLGLSIVRRTMRRWGGEAHAENDPSGRGARLTLRFPPPAEPLEKAG